MKWENVITIPDYWRMYVNPKVDLEKEPKQPCPFHHEEHGRSLSYSKERGYFSCFGACHVLGGDVVSMHMLNNKIKSRKEGEESLARLLGIKLTQEVVLEKKEVKVNQSEVELKVMYARALRLAKGPEDWIA